MYADSCILRRIDFGMMKMPHLALGCVPQLTVSSQLCGVACEAIPLCRVPCLPATLVDTKTCIEMASKIAAAARFKLVFYVPQLALAACKSAIFAAGAGRYPGPGGYTECCWSTMGTGQFRPGDTANPHIGKVGALEEVEEARVETLCHGEEVAKKAVEALKA